MKTFQQFKQCRSKELFSKWYEYTKGFVIGIFYDDDDDCTEYYIVLDKRFDVFEDAEQYLYELYIADQMTTEGY